jgi:hypothetical protein
VDLYHLRVCAAPNGRACWDRCEGDKGFKEVHINKVARALREFTAEHVIGTQVYNCNTLKFGNFRMLIGRTINQRFYHNLKFCLIFIFFAGNLA